MNSFDYIPLFLACTFEYVKSDSVRGLYEHVDMWIVSLEWNCTVWMAAALQFKKTSLPSSTCLQKVMPLINMNKQQEMVETWRIKKKAPIVGSAG